MKNHLTFVALALALLFSVSAWSKIESQTQLKRTQKKVSNSTSNRIIAQVNSPVPTKLQPTANAKLKSRTDTQAKPVAIVPRPKVPKDHVAIFKGGKYLLIKTKKIAGLELSANCFKDAVKNSQPKCTAADVATVKLDGITSSGPISNPASSLCEQLLGKNYIALSPQGSEFDYCGFSDNSFIDSWTLYEKVMKK